MQKSSMLVYLTAAGFKHIYFGSQKKNVELEVLPLMDSESFFLCILDVSFTTPGQRISYFAEKNRFYPFRTRLTTCALPIHWFC